MKYEGRLYGKVGGKHIQLDMTSKDVDELELKLKRLQATYKLDTEWLKAEKADLALQRSRMFNVCYALVHNKSIDLEKLREAAMAAIADV